MYKISFYILNKQLKQYINDNLIIEYIENPLYDKSTDTKEIVHLYFINMRDKQVKLPVGTWSLFSPNKYPNEDLKYSTITSLFTGNLLTAETDPLGRNRDQETVVGLSLKQLYTKHTTFLSLPTGFGKTCCGVYMSIKLGLKCCVLAHSDSVKNGWLKAYSKFTNAKVQLVKGDSIFDSDADIYIIGIFKSLNIPQILIDSAGIGTVIVDEAHMVSPTLFSKALPKFSPKYLIGLSATPDRKDGMHQLFYPYFGEDASFIKRFEKKEMIVYKYQTKYQPVIKNRMVKGKSVLDDNVRKNSLEYNTERQLEIANIAIKHPDKRIMILSDRQKQTEGIYNILKEKKESVGMYYSTMKSFDQNARILVVGTKKGGVGFDDESRDMLIIASYTDDVRQNEGRIRQNNIIIYHLVDDDETLENKWKKCQTWYRKRGATIKKIGIADSRKSTKRSSPKSNEIYTGRLIK